MASSTLKAVSYLDYKDILLTTSIKTKEVNPTKASILWYFNVSNSDNGIEFTVEIEKILLKYEMISYDEEGDMEETENSDLTIQAPEWSFNIEKKNIESEHNIISVYEIDVDLNTKVVNVTILV